MTRTPAMTDSASPSQVEPIPTELNAWADEAQAIVDAGDMPAAEIRKATTCVALLREAALRAAQSPSVRSALEEAQRSLIAAAIGSCTCITKTPELAYHAADCRYLKIGNALDAIESVLNSGIGHD
jgi:hypothetical protein